MLYISVDVGSRNDATAEVTSDGIITFVAGAIQSGQPSLGRQNDVWSLQTH